MTKNKKEKYASFVEGGIYHLQCKSCGNYVAVSDKDIVSTTCSMCVSNAIPLDDKPNYIPTGRPPGWHFMKEFVDKDGNVFHKGKEIPKLKGTLPPTEVKLSKKRKTKRRTKEQMLVAREKEKKAELKKAVQKQKDFINHNFGVK